jgi:hypothetical protein
MLMVERVDGTERTTLATDKGHDTKDFVSEMRGMNMTACFTTHEASGR